ncbi:MAG TPA: nitrate reductase, partial [Lachnospiraceae bacterium]|nr:nitrate reductase [Lachnospiraceae bacterium]
MFVQNGTGILKRVLLSPPAYLKPAPINEIAKQWKDTALDPVKMEREHKELIRVYEEQGVRTELLDPDPERPNAVFARDFGA